MVNKYEDQMVCDLAETYHILNWRALSPSLVATLVFGLSPTSRVMRSLSGQKQSDEILLLASIADRLSILVWQNTEDGHKGKRPPKSIVEELTKEKSARAYKTFKTSADFNAEWQRLVKEKG